MSTSSAPHAVDARRAARIIARMRSLARRLGVAALLFWLVLTITFALVRLAPGDAATLLVPPSATAADAERLRSELGLDAPMPLQYVRWLGRALRARHGGEQPGPARARSPTGSRNHDLAGLRPSAYEA